MQKYRIVCLAARPAGLNVVQALSGKPNLEIVAVLTHSKRATFEDPSRGPRPDFPLFEKLCTEIHVPLKTIDSVSEAKKLSYLDEVGIFDFLVCVSWRYLVSGEILKRPRIAAINLHRGQLPKYAGNFPLERVLKDGVKQATITAHLMSEEIDVGEILVEDHHAIERLSGETILDGVERVKKQLEPFYGRVAMAAIDKIALRHQKK